MFDCRFHNIEKFVLKKQTQEIQLWGNTEIRLMKQLSLTSSSRNCCCNLCWLHFKKLQRLVTNKYCFYECNLLSMNTCFQQWTSFDSCIGKVLFYLSYILLLHYLKKIENWYCWLDILILHTNQWPEINICTLHFYSSLSHIFTNFCWHGYPNCHCHSHYIVTWMMSLLVMCPKDNHNNSD